jgi:uncharacterized membrane protein
MDVAAASPLAAPAPIVAPARAAHARLDSVDLLRGAVMILMALDHARDFFTDTFFDPLDLSRTTPALYFTRWITHFCAPVFMFLAGTGASLSLGRGKTKQQLARFLITRGLFLIAADQIVMRILWLSRVGVDPFIAGTLTGLGWSMVALAGFIWLPSSAIVAIAVVLVAGHDAFDRFTGAAWGSLQWIWALLHGNLAAPSPHLFSLYPIVPWIGVMALGYVAGGLYRIDATKRRQVLFALGTGLCALFLALRWANVYGDPNVWTPQATGLGTLLSFLNCGKYRPSLLYLCMTLGPALIALAALERVRVPVANVVLLYGRVPMFYYFAHIALLHAAAFCAAAVAGKPLPFTAVFALDGSNPIPNYGWPLAVVYAAWISSVAVLYPACRWYWELKKRSDAWILGYV